MSYQSSALRRRHVARGIGDLIDDVKDMMDKAQSSQCDALAKSATAQIDAQRMDLVNNWKPTGYYSPGQMEQVTTAALTTLTNTAQAVAQAISDEGFLPTDTLEGVLASVQKRIGEAKPFTDAVSTAKANGTPVIDSTGFKRWVLNAMREASVALYAVSYTACLKPWWGPVMSGVAKVFTALYNITKSVVGVITQVGQAVLKVPDTVGTIFEIAKWGLIIGGGYYLAVQADLVEDHLGWKKA